MGILGHVSQIYTQRISVYIFCIIKASSGDMYALIVRNIYIVSECLFVKRVLSFPLCCLQYNYYTFMMYLSLDNFSKYKNSFHSYIDIDLYISYA